MSTTTKRKLAMEFGAETGGNTTVTLYDHRSDVTADDVVNVMVEVVALEALTNADGVLMTDVVTAKEVITTETVLF